MAQSSRPVWRGRAEVGAIYVMARAFANGGSSPRDD